MTSRKVPPPPPDANLSPFEVGAYLAGHVPEYAVHTIQTGGTTQAERIELRRRFMSSEGFAAWLETEDAKRTEVDPVRVVECSGFGGSATLEQFAEANAGFEKSTEIQAAHLAAVKTLRKAEATKAKKVSVLPDARAKRTGESRERDQEVFVAARSILAPLKQCITMNSLAQKVAEHLGEGWTRKSVAPRLKRVCGGLSQNKIQSSQNRSRD